MTTEMVDTTTGEIATIPTPVPAIPFFEGKPVDASALRITSSNVLDLHDAVLHVDDIVQIVVEARVNDVGFKVHEPTGRLVRVHSAKAINAYIKPYGDEDDGVVR